MTMRLMATTLWAIILIVFIFFFLFFPEKVLKYRGLNFMRSEEDQSNYKPIDYVGIRLVGILALVMFCILLYLIIPESVAQSMLKSF